MHKIVLATANPHKVEELRAVFAECGVKGVEFIALASIAPDGLPEPPETGTTFEENASIKARSYARQTGLTCLADDSGLEVAALGGKPGVISSHYCTDGQETGLPRPQRDAANNRKLLMQLEEAPPHRRDARFICVMALATGERVLATVRGILEGRIGVPPHVPRGVNGFGYDPLFLVGPDFTRTGAELLPEEKNRISHRARAARAMAEQVRRLFP